MVVETRNKTKADLAAAEAERTQPGRHERSPRSVRPVSATIDDDAFSLPRSTGMQTVRTPFYTEAQPGPAADCTIAHPDSQSEGNAKAPSTHICSVHSQQSRSKHTHSSRTSTDFHAQKLALEAETMRRQVERERELARQHAEREREQAKREHDRQLKLARLEAEAEHTELQAKLAALKVKSHSSRSSYFSNCNAEKRTATWVSEQNADMIDFDLAKVPGEAAAVTASYPHGLHSQPSAPTNLVFSALPDVSRAINTKPPHTTVNNNYGDTVTQQPSDHFSIDPITKLSHAINALSRRPKKPELPTFSGDSGQWMAFKSSYERSKSNFSASENVERLNNAIRGQAYQSVASLIWTSADPEDIMSSLEQTYARPELLVAREVAELRNTSKLSSPHDLNNLANKLRNFIMTLRLLKQYDYLSSPELFRCVLVKLSEHTRARFTDFAATSESGERNISKLELLSLFLLSEADKQLKFNFVFDTSFKTPTPVAQQPSRFHLRKEAVHATVSNLKSSEQCTYCQQGAHDLKTCKSFLRLTVDDRWRWVREARVCYRCMKSAPHTWNKCRAKCCGVDGCLRRHNALLHGTAPCRFGRKALPSGQCNTTQTSPTPISFPTSNPIDESNTDNESKPVDKITNTFDHMINATGLSPASSRPRGLLKVVPVVLEGPDGEFETTALLDEGSTATLIDGDVAARIGAKPTSQEHLRIEGVSGMTKELDVSYVNFYIRGRNLTDRYLVKDARAIKPLGLRTQHPGKINFMDYSHLSDLTDALTYPDASPTVLIGAPDWHLSISHEVKCGKRNEPVASRTLLGWVLHGAYSISSKPLEFVNFVDDDLDTLLKSQYDIDALGISKRTPSPNEEDQRALNIIDSSARQLDNGHFEVGLPWRVDLPKIIPDSYPQALSRFKALERQMSKDHSFANAFHQFINDIINKGYAEECDRKTYHKRLGSNASYVNTDGSVRWYLPIFGVFHPQKKKLRAVHDAAAATKGVSLNKLLLQGPDLLCSLLDILFRFREGAIALNGDIKEMFPQIKISARDRDAQRFLWRDAEGNLKEYRMSSMIFGAVSSPFIALHIKNKNARMLEADNPSACKEIIGNHYMDDYLGSYSTTSDAAQVAADIVTVHKACGFEMRAWTSNDPAALALVPKELRSDATSDVYLPPCTEVGVLGVKWNPQQDSLGFRAAPQMATDILTKRNLLSNVMKIYDPLGLLTPVVIWGRIIIQKLWRAGVDWDTPIPDVYVSECIDWYAQLQVAATVKIPRWYMSKSDTSDVQLHLVADGGEQAYACVAYWRFSYSDGSVSTSLIGSKARVSPLKPISIPRLELQAAVIATRFAQTIVNAHCFKPSTIVFWTDSSTVLKWIRSDARTYKTFVAHRLGEILETTNPSQWRWIPTSLNVADDATKPKKNNLTATHRWFSGPMFLTESPNTWPTECTIVTEESSPDLELKSDLVILLLDISSSSSVPNPTRFSSWLRLLRTTARVLQGARLFRRKLSRPILQNSKLFLDSTTSPCQLHAADIIEAEKMVVQYAQTESFAEEAAALRSSKPISKNSRIFKLAPILDDEGFLRLNTRISAAPGLNEETKSPVILDGRHHVTRLLIQHEHVKVAHQFNEVVLNELRQKYWILRARSTIRSVSNSCPQCRRWKSQTIQTRAGDLPVERLDHHKRPFTHVGVDYFGPILVTIHRRKEKRYVALYTCLTSRAVHLEVVNSLSSDAAIMSLRRFIARRGSPTTIYSDNGTNFVGASRELRRLHDDSVEEYATNHKIKWRFIPPASPFMGGAWERLVRTVKAAFRSCLINQSLKEEVLSTLLLEAEAIVNSRPLTYVPASPDSPEAITPFHFLLGSSSVAPWTASLTDDDLTRRSDWRKTLRLADHFWTRWLREYLPTLRPREATSRHIQLGEGDVVLIADPALPRGLWPLGRVVKVFLGPDGAVRVADIRTRGGVLRRPARKCILLEAAHEPVSTVC